MTDLPIVDSHVHFWDLDSMHYPWLEAVSPIRKSFLVTDYRRAIGEFPVQKMVFVQAECLPDQLFDEVDFVEDLALKDPGIQGIVAYAPMASGTRVIPILDELKKHPLVKGVRCMFDGDPTRCRSDDFLDAVRLLPGYDYSFDISIVPPSIPDTLKMISQCPETYFILDHLGKPDIQHHSLLAFQEHMDLFAAYPNVVAKLSGLITEASWNEWTPEDIRPFVDTALSRFGPERLMFGGDWPVVLLSGTWRGWVETLTRLLNALPSHDLKRIFFENACNAYRI